MGQAEAPVLRADFLLRAVPVPQGEHRVELVYRPLSVRLGLSGALLGLALVALCCVLQKKRSAEPRTKGSPAPLTQPESSR